MGAGGCLSDASTASTIFVTSAMMGTSINQQIAPECPIFTRECPICSRECPIFTREGPGPGSGGPGPGPGPVVLDPVFLKEINELERIVVFPCEGPGN